MISYFTKFVKDISMKKNAKLFNFFYEYLRYFPLGTIIQKTDFSKLFLGKEAIVKMRQRIYRVKIIISL